MIIAIAGNRYSGKFTLSKILGGLGFCDYNFSVLDEPKLELETLLRSKTGISPFTVDYEQRLLIDDFIYSYKNLIEKTDKNYWLNKLEYKIKDIDNTKSVIIIRDINTLEEFNWAWQKNILTIYVTRYNKDGAIIEGFMNKNYNWSHKLLWPTSNDIEFLTSAVQLQLKELLNLINKQ
ncbi:MAG: hypothetical protein Q7R95_06210 [bacterium]|nr:hypothetical protein [bacterium]